MKTKEELKLEIMRKHLKKTEGENGISVFFAYQDAMEEYASQAKPVEPIKTKIDWEKMNDDYIHWWVSNCINNVGLPHPNICFAWLKERIEKELNSSE